MRRQSEKISSSQLSGILAFVFLTLFVGIGALENDITSFYKSHTGLVWVIFSMPAVILFAWQLRKYIPDWSREASTENEINGNTQKETNQDTLKILKPRILDIFYRLVDNPLTQSFALASWAVPAYYYFNLNLERFVTLDDYYQIINIFSDWFGLGYTIIIALVISNVWSKFDAIDRIIDRETTNVLFLYENIQMLSKSKVKNELLVDIALYIDHLIANLARETVDSNVRRMGDKLMTTIRKNIGLMPIK